LNKLGILACIVVVVLLASITAFVYSQSVNQFQANQKENTSPTPTANPTVSSSPNPTLSPTPTPSPLPDASPPLDPAAYGAFDGPLGSFWISSPTNTTYNTNSLTLTIGGQTIIAGNVHLSMYYSVDGQEKKAVNVEARNANTFAGTFTGSLVLPPLDSGEHSVTVFGDLEANGSHLAQVTVDFTVQ
jgi:cytoskeletal protein RodZ